MSRRTLRAGTCNFEENGRRDPEIWRAMHERLASLDLDVLCRQETKGCGLAGSESRLWDASKDVLRMEGELGPGKHATAVYWSSDTFKKTETWDTDWPGFWLHPTAVTLRLRDAEDIEVVCGSAHLSYAACTDRAGEAENLLRLPDRVHTPDDEQRRKVPVLALGLDGNSYADEAGRVPGEPGVPRPEQIKDVQHLAHRSRFAPGGERIMDCEPHRILTGGGLTDTARFHAPQSGQADPVVATSEAKPAQGPATRIDFLFTSGLLAPALTRVEVVPMTGLSDHHTVLAEWDLTLLTEICRDHFGPAA